MQVGALGAGLQFRLDLVAAESRGEVKDPRHLLHLRRVSEGGADLQGELERLRATLPEVAVVIRSHKDLAVQRLVDVMDAVQRAKITKVGVVTTPETP